MKTTSIISPRRSSSPAIELLESRIAPAALVVTTLSDDVAVDGFISLREAIQAANTNLAVNEAAAGDADGDTITFDALLSGTVALTAVLSITDDLSIDGGGNLLDGLDAVQIFNINTTGGAGTVQNVSLSNLAIEDGAVTGNGGAIAHIANTLTLTGVDISSSSANGAGASGGAIFSSGILVVNGGTFSGNTAVRAGGAIEVTAGSTTTLNVVTVTQNSTGPTPGNGGGLHITGAGSVTVNNSTFSNNTASSEGGGLWNSSTGTLIINDTLITNNTAAGDIDPAGNLANLQGGGGVFNDGGTLTISGATIQFNQATGATRGSGGGVMSIAGLVTIADSSVSNNEAIRAGGGIEIITGTVNITGSTLAFNDVSATGLLATANPGNGGGLHVTGAATVTIRDSQISSNAAGAEGGGLWNSATGTLTVFTGFIDGNTAFGNGTEQGGGGVFNDGGTVTIRDTSIFSNVSTATAVGNGGGGIFNDGTMTLLRVGMAANTATDGTANGGAILNSDGGTLTIGASAIGSNSAARAGGAIENNLGTVFIHNSDFNINSAGINGGAIHTSGAGSVTVIGGSFDSNTAGNEGGALWNSGAGNMSVTGATIVNNVAAVGGGLFQKGTGGTLSVTASTIASNSATGPLGGGGLATEGGTVEIVQSTFAYNTTSTGPAGGLLIASGIVNISNSTIVGNTSPATGANIHQNDGTLTLLSTIVAESGVDEITRTAGTLNASFSLLEEPAVGAVNGTDVSNIYATDPNIGSLDQNGGFTETFLLNPGSPAIDTGANPLALTHDQRGNPFSRTLGTGTDIGATESLPQALVTISTNGKKATYTDQDGDLVTITTNVGTFQQSHFEFVSEGIGARLDEFNIDGLTAFAGANIAIKAKRSALGGDGFANVEDFSAEGIDLGKVRIDGDLIDLNAGDSNPATPGLLSLSVVSISAFDHDGEIEIHGSLGELKVLADIYETDIEITGGPSANLGKVKIGGSVYDTDFEVDGSVTSITIGGSTDHTDFFVTGSIGSFATTSNPDKFRAIGGITIRGNFEDSDIAVDGDLANLRVGGYIENLLLNVRGHLAPATLLDAQTLGSVRAGGGVFHSDFLIGYDEDFIPVNPSVQVGSISVKGDWIASNFIVGGDAGLDGLDGTADDTAIGGGGSILSRIASITIKGHAHGNLEFSLDRYAITAQEIGKAKISRASLPLTDGSGNDLSPLFVGIGFDFAIRELPTV